MATACCTPRMIATFVMGTRRVFDFVDDNPSVNLLDVEYVNNPDVIRRNDEVIAINSAIEIDLTGQVCADSIGTSQYSGVGGQMDFVRGAARSEGGEPIIALRSTTRLGTTRIVPTLREGAGVITTRARALGRDRARRGEPSRPEHAAVRAPAITPTRSRRRPRCARRHRSPRRGALPAETSSPRGRRESDRPNPSAARHRSIAAA